MNCPATSYGVSNVMPDLRSLSLTPMLGHPVYVFMGTPAFAGMTARGKSQGIHWTQKKIIKMSAPPESSKNKSVLHDRCGNPIDPDVGYARGNLLSTSLDEFRRYQHALRLIQIRAAKHGRDSFYNFTGLQRHCNLGESGHTAQDEWLAPAFFQDELKRLTREHLGALPGADIAVFNRASSGIVATCLALCPGGSTVIAVTPGKPHPSIPRGGALANAFLMDAGTLKELEDGLKTGKASLVIITGVSSELDVIEADLLQGAVNMAKRKGVPSLLDDAYGARLRPIVYHQPKTPAACPG